MNTVHTQAEEVIDSSVLSKWKRLLDLTIEVIGVPAAVITRTAVSGQKNFLLSGDEDCGFQPGEHLSPSAAIFAAAVAEEKQELAMEDASLDKRWKKTVGNADGFSAFLGFPLRWQDGEVFGTLCVMDTKKRQFSELNRRLLREFTEIIQDDISNHINQSISLSNMVRVEKDLKDEIDRFNQTFQASTSGILITSLTDGVILDANYTYQKLFGYSYEELVGRSAAELNIYVHAEDREHVINKLRKGEQVRDYEMTRQSAPLCNCSSSFRPPFPFFSVYHFLSF